jgi:hypothetical protein
MSGGSMMAGGIYQMLSPQPKGLQGETILTINPLMPSVAR